MRGAMRSKMVWLGFALAVFGALYDNFNYIQELVSPRFYGISLIVIGVIVAVLRFVTTLPLDKKCLD